MGRMVLESLGELMDRQARARLAARRASRRSALLREVWRLLLARGEPIPVDAIARAVPGSAEWRVRLGLARLDQADLLLIEAGRVRLAYPLSAEPTAFAVALPDGRGRFACCAIDALGIAPMLGRPIRVRSACHHCGGPLAFPVHPEGVGPGAEGIVVWVGRRDPDQRRAFTGH